jgi:hypothetical protein
VTRADEDQPEHLWRLVIFCTDCLLRNTEDEISLKMMNGFVRVIQSQRNKGMNRLI